MPTNEAVKSVSERDAGGNDPLRTLSFERGLPAASQFGQEKEGALGVARSETDAVIAKIDINVLAFNLNAVNGAGKVDVTGVAQQGANGVFPRGREFVKKLDGGFGGFRADL